MKLYLAVTADEYELPVCVEEDYHVLARLYGITPNCLLSQIGHGSSGKQQGVKFIRVVIDDDNSVNKKEVQKNINPVTVLKLPKIRKNYKNMIYSDMEL